MIDNDILLLEAYESGFQAGRTTCEDRPKGDLDGYQREAARTRAGNPDIFVGALGLAGEVGEFADHVKKWYAQGHPLDHDKLINELGDILWYIACSADALGADLSEIARRNIEKLRVRYPNGFTTEASMNRNDSPWV